MVFFLLDFLVSFEHFQASSEHSLNIKNPRFIHYLKIYLPFSTLLKEVFKISRKSFLVYFDWEVPLQELNNEELGELFRAMFLYAKYGEEFDFEHRSLKLVFGFIKNAIERDRVSYEEKCKKNAENGAKGGKKKAEKPKEVSADISCEELLKTLLPSE